jgi:hypothetical protein
MNIYSPKQDDEFINSLRDWCKKNPDNKTEYQNQNLVPSWNKGIPTSDETKKLISISKKGISVNKGLKRPYAKDNLKKIKHRAYGQFEIVEPNGSKQIISNLKSYCMKKNLNYTSMSSLSNGKWPNETYKGYKSKKIGYVKIHR